MGYSSSTSSSTWFQIKWSALVSAGALRCASAWLKETNERSDSSDSRVACHPRFPQPGPSLADFDQSGDPHGSGIGQLRRQLLDVQIAVLLGNIEVAHGHQRHAHQKLQTPAGRLDEGLHRHVARDVVAGRADGERQHASGQKAGWSSQAQNLVPVYQTVYDSVRLNGREIWDETRIPCRRGVCRSSWAGL